MDTSVRSRRVACIACRQNKSRCEKGQGPCSRCSRHGLSCREDPRFRRMSKSRKIEELEKQVQNCVSAISHTRYHVTHQNVREGHIHTDTFADASLELPRDPLSAEPYLDSTGRTDNVELPLQTFSPMRGYSDPSNAWPQLPNPNNPNNYDAQPAATTSRHLGTIEITKTQINTLFKTFFEHYHPFLPFLNPSISPDCYFDQSPLLFWAIIAVASRRYEEDITLLRFLSAPVTKYTWATIAELPNTISTVQALVILCSWPFPASSLWLETTPIWTSIAVSIAQQLGLHRPGNAAEFVRVKPALDITVEDERTRTWAACSIVAQNTAASFGHLLTTSFGLGLPISRELEHIQRLPYALQQQITIQKFCAKVEKAMFDTPSILDLQPLSDIDHLVVPLEAELLGLEESLGMLSHINHLYLLSAKLFLSSHYFFIAVPSPNKQQGILKAYTAAETLISSMSKANSTFNLYPHITSYLFRMLFTAACVILRVYNSIYRNFIDRDTSNILFGKAVSALHKCSVANNDNAGRQAEILVQLWRGQIGTNTDKRISRDPVIEHDNRYSASLAYDCLFYWRDHIGGQAARGLNSSTTLPVDGAREETSPLFNGAGPLLDGGEIDDLQVVGFNGLGGTWDLEELSF